MVDVLAEKKKEKFGEPRNYDGPTDASEAPSDFFFRHPADDIFPSQPPPTVPVSYIHWNVSLLYTSVINYVLNERNI